MEEILVDGQKKKKKMNHHAMDQPPDPLAAVAH